MQSVGIIMCGETMHYSPDWDVLHAKGDAELDTATDLDILSVESPECPRRFQSRFREALTTNNDVNI